RGVLKQRLKDNQGAISDYSKAIEINPEDAYAYSNRGNAKYESGDQQGACADWRKASSLGDKDAAGWVRDQCQ
ncbi:MAG: tetratricopeptide repeat protein, partial [Prochlorococcaceae cyanobacterium ETNP14_MAG_5]|nr:tetratricopeptide repeat protein [Prochlorococcaceae cyanobacterium ETNP14_MAG_5]